MTERDEAIAELVELSGKRVLAAWARDSVERVLPYFEEQRPGDRRPRSAIAALQEWLDTGVFRMKDIRKASLDAHAAAREVGEDNPARSAARAAGQAVATAHVARHAVAAARYSLQAMYRAAAPIEAESAVNREREWQLQHLRDLQA